MIFQSSKDGRCFKKLKEGFSYTSDTNEAFLTISELKKLLSDYRLAKWRRHYQASDSVSGLRKAALLFLWCCKLFAFIYHPSSNGFWKICRVSFFCLAIHYLYFNCFKARAIGELGYFTPRIYCLLLNSSYLAECLW